MAPTQGQKEAREKAGEEQLPERGSPVGVQRALPQEGAAREAGAKQLPDQGGPVGVQLNLCQEKSWAEARGRPEAEMERACGKTGGNGEGEQESCGNGDKRQAGHPVPVGHESRRRRIWEPGKPHSELRQ